GGGVERQPGLGHPARLCVGSDDFAVDEMTERDVLRKRFAGLLAGLLIGDRPEVIRSGPGDPPFVTATDRGVEVPAAAVVGVDARRRAFISSGDQHAAIRRPKLDVANFAKWNGGFDARRYGLLGMPFRRACV